MTSQQIRQYLTLTCETRMPKLLFIHPSPTHILYQCATFGDDWTSFNPHFDISVFYFLAISRDIDLKFIQDTNNQFTQK